MIKGNNIFWDLDGVLRNLTHGFNGEWPKTWIDINKDGLNIYEWVDANLNVLELAPVTEYMEIAMMCDPLHIVSCQPDAWRPYTSRWLDKHLPYAKVKYMTDTNDKLKYLVSGKRILIEDYPNFIDYSHVIVIDRPYNRSIELPHIRAHNPSGLLTMLEVFTNGN
jgi:hypothetical protein